LRNFLNSHEAWKDFIPVLRDETYGQLVTDYPPPPHSGPLNPFVQHDFSSFASKPLKPLTRDDISIDLGSKYANNLGFDGKAPYAPQEQKRKRKRKKGGKKAGDDAAEEGSSHSTEPQNGTAGTSEKKAAIGNNSEKKEGGETITVKDPALASAQVNGPAQVSSPMPIGNRKGNPVGENGVVTEKEPDKEPEKKVGVEANHAS